MPWVREGECNRCGDCCRSGDPFTGLPGICPIAIENADGTVTCGNRESGYYVMGCNVWPSIPEHISAYPNCSYTFRWVSDGN